MSKNNEVIGAKQYGMRVNVGLSYADALAATRAALQAEGFGVLTEIDIREKMKEKLNVDFRPYMILGACNPPLAYRALSAEIDIGLLLPCNVIVYQQAEGESVVAAIDPVLMIGFMDNQTVHAVADEARTKLLRVLDSVARTAKPQPVGL